MNEPDATAMLPEEFKSSDGEPVFREPWEAQAFAMAVMLHEKGVFTWPEWTQVLSSRIAQAVKAGDPDTGDTYYLHWLGALETLVARKGLADPATLQNVKQAWDVAAKATPHGQPIVLPSDKFHVLPDES